MRQIHEQGITLMMNWGIKKEQFSVRYQGHPRMTRYNVVNPTHHVPDGSRVSGVDDLLCVATENYIYWYRIVEDNELEEINEDYFD